MKIFRWLACSVLLMEACIGYCQEVLKDHKQLLVVISSDWNEVRASLQRYERASKDESWTLVGERIPVVLGKAGLAWGLGLQPFPINKVIPLKREGDLKSPAGIFSIGTAFGFSPNSEMNHLKMDYIQVNDTIEAVDDSQSQHYNCIVNSHEVDCDWKSSEKMAEISLYKLGFVVNHNYPNPQFEAGSCIFFHIWRHENSGTAGCTVMTYENLNKVVCWLDADKNPALVQLPQTLYDELQKHWFFP